jgi:hypothetical protein
MWAGSLTRRVWLSDVPPPCEVSKPSRHDCIDGGFAALFSIRRTRSFVPRSILPIFPSASTVYDFFPFWDLDGFLHERLLD